ncbi:hypothetical protein M0P48_05395 [Candidatus Gracilibacteria bacterium]|nr:hypothetical protein [Candidatus Gracilibacteria bacterium]
MAEAQDTTARPNIPEDLADDASPMPTPEIADSYSGYKANPDVTARILGETETSIRDFLINFTEPVLTGAQRSSRVLRVTQGSNTGMVLVSRSDGDEKTLSLMDIASAGRRIDHITDETYPEEIKKLEQIEEKLQKMTTRIYDERAWKAIKSTGELELFQAEIVEMVNKLRFVRVKEKLEILDRLNRCVTFQDSQGRYNPPTRLAIWTSTYRFIQSRKINIERISGHLAKDRVSVTAKMQEEAKRLNWFYSVVTEKAGELKILDVNEPLDDVLTIKIATNLRALISSCEGFKFEPYISFAKKIIAETRAIIEILNSPNHNEKEQREKAKQSFVKIYSMAKLLNIEDELIAARTDTFDSGKKPEKIFTLGLLRRLVDIKERFSQKRLDESVEVKDLNPIYGEIFKFLNTIISNLRQDLGKCRNEEDRVFALKKVEKTLKDFSVAKLLQSQELEEKVA